jgi:CubicO group peptidase (beta-lactamase class C family)
VAIVQNGELKFAKGFGVKDISSNRPVTADTRFAIGSTSKAFTTAAMGILVDDGRMQWDDPVRKHVPFFRLSDPLADANVTMRDLVCHRTGLSRHDLLWYGSPFSREEIIRKVSLVPLTRPYRSAYQYQNIMFLTAGYAAGLISGGAWEALVESRILDPLGMKNTDFSVVDVVKAPDYATPHEKRDEKVQTILWRNIDNIAPAGSINSSVSDLARWARMQLGEGSFEGRKILKPETIREMHTPQMVVRMDDPNLRELNEGTNMMAYGLGWAIQDYRGHHLVGHGGAIDGFRAQVALFPKDKLGIVILANLGGSSMPESLRSAIADELLGLPPIDWNAKHLAVAKRQAEASKKRLADREAKRKAKSNPSLELDSYAGAYDHAAYGNAVVSRTEHGLQLKWSSWSLPLEHFHYDVFRVAGGVAALKDTLVEFALNAEGQVASLKFVEQVFSRKKP